MGGDGGWSDTAWSVVASRIADQGVPCTISAGNDGASGIFDPSEAADGQNVMSIASSDNSIYPLFPYVSYYSIDGADYQEFTYLPGGNATERLLWNMTMPLYAVDLAPYSGEGCPPLPDDIPDLSKYIVLMRDNWSFGCTLEQQLSPLHAKGADYVLLHQDIPGLDIRPTIGGVLAVGMMRRAASETLLKAFKAGRSITLDMRPPSKETQIFTFDDNTLSAGAASDYTSWGPTWQMDVKPQLGAPGGKIVSTWPDNRFAVLDGTSMSCPLVAACIGLVAQVRGTSDNALMKNLISATAKPQIWNDGWRFFEGLAPVAQQGAGFIQAYDAAFTKTLLEPSSLSFNDTEHRTKQHTFVISNKGNSEVTYNISHVPAVSMYVLRPKSVYLMSFPNEIFDSSATLHFSDQVVTLLPGHRKIVTVSAQPPQNADATRFPFWSGYVTINGTDGSALSLPYQGLTGSLRNATLLDARTVFVSTSNIESGEIPVPENTTFSVPPPGATTDPDKDALPCCSFELQMGSRKARCDIVPLTTCPPKNLTVDDPLGSGKFKTIGQPAHFPMVSQSYGFSYPSWNGLLDSGVYAPPGKYKFIVRALRIFGDENKLDDWDVQETVGFRLEYKA